MNTKYLVIAALIASFTVSTSWAADSAKEIKNCQDLQDIVLNLSASYKIVNDIDCTGTLTWNKGAGFLPIGSGSTSKPFSGVLDGQGHTIKGLYHAGWIKIYDITEFSTKGVFGSTNGATIKNITLEDIYTNGGVVDVGGLVGNAKNTKIDNVHIVSRSNKGTVIGSSISRGYLTIVNLGGLVGSSSDDTVISHCSVDARVIGHDRVGGVVGLNRATIKDSSFSGKIQFIDGLRPAINIGPVVARNEWPHAKVENVYSTGEVYIGQGGDWRWK